MHLLPLVMTCNVFCTIFSMFSEPATLHASIYTSKGRTYTHVPSPFSLRVFGGAERAAHSVQSVWFFCVYRYLCPALSCWWRFFGSCWVICSRYISDDFFAECFVTGVDHQRADAMNAWVWVAHFMFTWLVISRSLLWVSKQLSFYSYISLFYIIHLLSLLIF